MLLGANKMPGEETVISYHNPPPQIALTTTDINQLFMREIELGVWLFDVKMDTMRKTEMNVLKAKPALVPPMH